jgi:hypothetical protein
MSSDDLDQGMAEWLRQREEETTRAKTALFDYLAQHHPQIARIEAGYSGSGDEGFVDEVSYYDSATPDGKRIEVPDDHLGTLMDDLFIGVTPDGFENNEGGEGEIHIYPATRKIIVHHRQNIITQEHETYEV